MNFYVYFKYYRIEERKKHNNKFGTEIRMYNFETLGGIH